jgi:hypothetical protein
MIRTQNTDKKNFSNLEISTSHTNEDSSISNFNLFFPSAKPRIEYEFINPSYYDPNRAFMYPQPYEMQPPRYNYYDTQQSTDMSSEMYPPHNYGYPTQYHYYSPYPYYQMPYQPSQPHMPYGNKFNNI